MFKAFRGYYDIIRHEEISDGIFELRVKAPKIAGAASAGEFVNIYLPGGSMLLPRPVSITDAAGGTLTLVYAVVGKGTKALSQIAEGGKLEIMGPLGTGFFDYPGSPLDESFLRGRQGPDGSYRVFLIGGGAGIPPLYFAARRLKAELHGGVKVEAFLGFSGRTWYEDEFAAVCDKVNLCSETCGAAEFHGNVVELMDSVYEAPPEAGLALVVGPKPMLAAVSQWCALRGVPLRVSLEERMGCGYGACAGCTVKTRPLSDPSKPQNGPDKPDEEGIIRKKVCVHGPVFWADEVIL